MCVSADEKLETENEEEDNSGAEPQEIPRFISNNVYHPKKALR